MSAVSPVIIVGAARSGTRLVRSIVAAGEEFAPVPFDVNYIWRDGQGPLSDDVIPPDAATPEAAASIRRRLYAAAGIERGNGRLVEKTVSNTLRLPFVRRVFPDACFVHVRRDGRDVAESALRCWQETPDPGRLLRKLRSVPPGQLLSYGWDYLTNQVGRVLGQEDHVRSWGPRYPGIDEDVEQLPLLEVCFRQWARSVEAVERDTSNWDPDLLLTVDYEELVGDPAAEAGRIASFIGAAAPAEIVAEAVDLTEPGHVGKYQRLPEPERQRLEDLFDRHQQTTAPA